MAINLNHTSDSLSPDSGTANVTGDLAVTGVLKSNNSSGDEGGQLDLANAKTNTNIVTGVSIDVYQNKVRIFETGGTNRGYYFDMNTAAAAAGTQVGASSGGGSNTDTLATITARGNTTSNVILITSNLEATGANTGAFRVEGGISSNANIFASGNITSSKFVGGNIFSPGNLIVYANNVETMRIVANNPFAGNVGIGTSRPQSALHVNAAHGIRVSGGLGSPFDGDGILQLGNDLVTDSQNFFLRSSPSGNGLFYLAQGVNPYSKASAANTALVISCGNPGSFKIGLNGTGNSPVANLHVVGNIYGSTGITTTGNIGLPAVGNITGTTTSFIITSGNVGIGTTAPTAKLHVVGNIHTTTGVTTAGNILISASGSRILGDLSNNTLDSRLLFQSTTANTGASLGIIPNSSNIGGGQVNVAVFNSSNVANASVGLVAVDSGSVLFSSTATGTSRTLPMLFYVGSERVRIDTGGNVGIGISTPGNKLHVSSSLTGTTPRSNPIARIQSEATGRDAHIQLSDNVTYSAELGMVSGNLYFATGGVEKGRFDLSGNFGIGTTSPARLLHVAGTSRVSGSNGILDFINGNTSGGMKIGIYTAAGPADGYLAFEGYTKEYARFDSSGNFGIGTTLPSKKFVVSNAGAAGLELDPFTRSAGTGASLLAYNRSTSAYVRMDYDASEQLFFIGGSEKARFTTDGNFLVGVSGWTTIRLGTKGSGTTSGSYAFYAENSAGAWLCGIRDDGAFSTGMTGMSPYNLTTGNAANMWVESSGYMYRSTSSRRYKRDIQDAYYGLSDLLKLRPVTYKSSTPNSSGSIPETVYGGLIAEEVHDANLQMFVQYNEENQPDALSYGNMVALCVKAIQEQQEIIANLKVRIDTLESRGT